MAAEKYPVTPAIRALRAAGVRFGEYLFDYVERGGTKQSADALGVSEHQVIKTLVMENEARKPLIVLMHGDREVATGLLAKALGVKGVTPCLPEVAQKHTGYLVGGTSPFGTKTPNLPIYVERTILDLPEICINGGKRGFVVSIAPEALRTVLGATPLDVAVPVT